jgi:Fe-S-cluster-containing hydrogenase component 2/CRP-like cAMP-binding protein
MPERTFMDDAIDHKRELLTARELKAHPDFASVPAKFLLWQQGLAFRRRLKPGDVVCRQGDPGNTAFLIRQGKLEVRGYAAKPAKRFGVSLGGRLARASRGEPLFKAPLTPKDVIVGEMACLAGTARVADVVAVEESEVWEIRRNLLERMMRSPSQRARFDALYKERALGSALRQSDLFRDQPGDPFPADEYAKCLEFLRDEKANRLSFVRVNPGQTVFRQGDWAEELYLVRLGHLRVSVMRLGVEGSVAWRGPGSIIGEVGLLALAPEDMRRDVNEVEREMALALASVDDADLGMTLPAGRRTATCTALDQLELGRVRRADFLQLVKRFPTVRKRLVRAALGGVERTPAGPDADRLLTQRYYELGLFQATNLLALDLTKCTHCDECTKACVQQHGTESHGVPVTRLLRDGVRFGQHLVASSCRSCKDAPCMNGCPVDAIHRGKHGQIVIEDHCIGCKLCFNNCPYGNIFMVPNENCKLEVPHPEIAGETVLIAQPKAATCDLCDAEGERATPLPRCVHACPHDAAHRMTGKELLDKVIAADMSAMSN